MKTCLRCHETKSVDEFYKRSASKDGRSQYCKECRKSEVRGYRERNASRCKAYSAKWYANNKERCSDTAFNRYGRNNVLEPSLFVEAVSRQIVFQRDNWTCGLCNKAIPQNMPTDERAHPSYPNVDHKVPLSKGGEHSYINTWAVHRSCNNIKKDRLVEELEDK